MSAEDPGRVLAGLGEMVCPLLPTLTLFFTAGLPVAAASFLEEPLAVGCLRKEAVGPVHLLGNRPSILHERRPGLKRVQSLLRRELQEWGLPPQVADFHSPTRLLRA